MRSASSLPPQPHLLTGRRAQAKAPAGWRAARPQPLRAPPPCAPRPSAPAARAPAARPRRPHPPPQPPPRCQTCTGWCRRCSLRMSAALIARAEHATETVYITGTRVKMATGRPPNVLYALESTPGDRFGEWSIRVPACAAAAPSLLTSASSCAPSMAQRRVRSGLRPSVHGLQRHRGVGLVASGAWPARGVPATGVRPSTSIVSLSTEHCCCVLLAGTAADKESVDHLSSFSQIQSCYLSPLFKPERH